MRCRRLPLPLVPVGCRVMRSLGLSGGRAVALRFTTTRVSSVVEEARVYTERCPRRRSLVVMSSQWQPGNHLPGSANQNAAFDMRSHGWGLPRSQGLHNEIVPGDVRAGPTTPQPESGRRAVGRFCARYRGSWGCARTMDKKTVTGIPVYCCMPCLSHAPPLGITTSSTSIYMFPKLYHKQRPGMQYTNFLMINIHVLQTTSYIITQDSVYHLLQDLIQHWCVMMEIIYSGYIWVGVA